MQRPAGSIAAPEPRARSAAAIALAGLAALAAGIGIGRFAFTAVLPMMQAEAAVSLAEAGWLAAANYAGYLVGALAAVALPLPPRSAIRGALLAVALLTLAMGFEQRFASWMALRALAGVASAWLVVFVSTWCLEQLAALRRPDLAGMVFAGVGSGIALSGALCLMLMQADASAAQAWIALGIAALALAALSWSAIGEHGEAPSLPAAAARPQAFRPDAQSLRLVFSYGAFGFGYIIPATFLPLMAKRVIEDPAVFGWSWPLFGAAAAVSTLLAAAVPAARSGRRLWIAAQLVMALGVALPVLWPGIMAIMLAALCVGGTFMVITMAGIQEAHRLAGTHARGLIAAMTSAFAVGQIAGPLWVSFASGRDGEFSSALLAASLLLALGAGALMTRRQR